MNNNKEYIVCAAYKFKPGYETPRMVEINQKNKGFNPDFRVQDTYFKPHCEVFETALGWRHPDIILKYGDVIDINKDGFMTSKGRFVDRKEAHRIALECGQIIEKESINSSILFTEDIY